MLVQHQMQEHLAIDNEYKFDCKYDKRINDYKNVYCNLRLFSEFVFLWQMQRLTSTRTQCANRLSRTFLSTIKLCECRT